MISTLIAYNFLSEKPSLNQNIVDLSAVQKSAYVELTFRTKSQAFPHLLPEAEKKADSLLRREGAVRREFFYAEKTGWGVAALSGPFRRRTAGADILSVLSGVSSGRNLSGFPPY
jgi:hypothetical protein